MRKGRFMGMATFALAFGILVATVTDAEARCGRRGGRRQRGCGSCATACASGGCTTHEAGYGSRDAAAPAPAPESAPPAPAPGN